jgi:hypothetical protein
MLIVTRDDDEAIARAGIVFLRGLGPTLLHRV